MLESNVLGRLCHRAEAKAPASHHVVSIAVRLHHCVAAMHRKLLVVAVCHVAGAGRDDSLTGCERYCDMDTELL